MKTMMTCVPAVLVAVSLGVAGEEQHLYVAEDAGNIYRLALNGVSTLYAEIPGPNRGLDMDEDGTLWIFGGGGTLYRVTTGEEEPATVANGRVVKFTDGIREPLGMGIDANGNFWVGEHYHGVVIVDRNTRKKTFIDVGKGGCTYSVERGPDGLMYVSRQHGNTLFRFRPDGTPLEGTSESPEPYVRGYGNGHRSIVFRSQDEFLLIRQPEISRFKIGGQYLGSFFKWEKAKQEAMTREQFIARGMTHPMDLAVDAGGTVYSSDQGYSASDGRIGGAVYKYNPDGTRELFFEAKYRINWMTFWPKTCWKRKQTTGE